MSCRIINEYRAGATRPSLLFQLWSDKDDAPMPIAGKTIVFDMANIMTGVLKVEDGEVVIIDSANAVVRYDFAVGDLDTPGRYDPVMVLDKGGDEEQPFPKEKGTLIIEVK